MKRWIFILLLLSACTPKGEKADFGAVIYAPRYAEGFTIHERGVRITHPWGEEWVPTERPLRRIVAMSASHVGFIDALGQAGRVVGISGVRYISSKNVPGVPDVGYEGNLNYELVASLRPDAMLIYSVAGERLPVLDKLRELGIPVILIGDYLELSPLGKAEWVVAFGAMLGRQAEAEAFFGRVRADYLAARKLAAGAIARPKVMLNAPWRDAWFVPGAGSYMVRLIEDAGGAYACADLPTPESRAIDAETAWRYASTADVWLHPNEVTTLAALLAQHPRLADIPPLVRGQVYNNNLRATPGGGSDFWESGAVRPDLILKDLIRILHPELLPGHSLYYYRPLE